jgi:hypothetical protein
MLAYSKAHAYSRHVQGATSTIRRESAKALTFFCAPVIKQEHVLCVLLCSKHPGNSLCVLFLVWQAPWELFLFSKHPGNSCVFFLYSKHLGAIQIFLSHLLIRTSHRQIENAQAPSPLAGNLMLPAWGAWELSRKKLQWKLLPNKLEKRANLVSSTVKPFHLKEGGYHVSSTLHFLLWQS